MMRWITRGFVGLSIAFIAFVIAELAYGGQEPRWQREIFFNNPHAYSSHDPDLGWVNQPFMRGVMQRRSFNTRIVINSDGMRYGEVAAKQGTRIAVLGDSFTWGKGVQDWQRYTNILENRLKTEILNFSVNDYSPVQYDLMLDRVFSYEPDIVLLALNPATDFSKSVSNYFNGYYRPYAALEDGKLVIKGQPVPDNGYFGTHIRSPLTNFALYRLLYRSFGIDVQMDGETFEAYVLPDKVGAPKVGYDANLVYKKEGGSEVQDSVKVVAALLKDIREKCEARHVMLLVAGMPVARDLKNNRALEFYRQAVKEAGVRSLDINIKSLEKDDFFKNEPYWEPSGHAKIADALEPSLRKAILTVEKNAGIAKK